MGSFSIISMILMPLMLVVLVYLIWTIVVSTDKICRAISILLVAFTAIELLLRFNFMPDFLIPLFGLLRYLKVLAMIIFAVRLFLTAQQFKELGASGQGYYYVIAISLAVISIFSFPEIYQCLGDWYYQFYVRKWPDVAIVITVIAMRVKKVSFSNDENRLLWYYAFISLLSTFFLFF